MPLADAVAGDIAEIGRRLVDAGQRMTHVALAEIGVVRLLVVMDLVRAQRLADAVEQLVERRALAHRDVVDLGLAGLLHDLDRSCFPTPRIF